MHQLHVSDLFHTIILLLECMITNYYNQELLMTIIKHIYIDSNMHVNVTVKCNMLGFVTGTTQLCRTQG